MGEVYSALKQALELDEQLRERLRDPCLSSEERRDLEKMQRDNQKTIEYMFKTLQDLGIDMAKSTVSQGLLPPKVN